MSNNGTDTAAAAAAVTIHPLAKDELAKDPSTEANTAASASPSPALSTRRLSGSTVASGSSAAVTPLRPPRSMSSIYRTLAMPHTEAPARTATPTNGTSVTPSHARAKSGSQPPLARVSTERSDGLLALDAEHDKSDGSGGNNGGFAKVQPTPSAKFVRQLQLSTTNAQIEAMAKDRSAREAAATAAASASASASAEAAHSDSAAPMSDSGSAPPVTSAEPLRHQLSQSDAVAEVLDWSGKGLRAAGVEGGWSLYPSIHTLILRDNELTTLLKQGIDQLPNLHTLDLRRNRLSGFGDTLLVLSQCRALKHVYLHQSTRDNVTNNVSLYTDFVFQSLRGLESCDGVQSKLTIALNPLDQSAFEFIHMLSGGMSENALLRCDLSNKKLPANLFFFLLSALHQLKIAWLKLDGDNEWSSLNSYTNCVIYYLGKYLLYLDEEEITNQRLHLALKAQAESKIKIIKIAWSECWDEALEVGREYLERLEIEREEMEEKERIWRHMRALDAGEDTSEFGNAADGQDSAAPGTLGAATASSAAVAEIEAKRRQSQLDGDFMPLTAEEQKILDDAAGEEGNGKDKNEKEKDDATGFNLHIPGRGIGAGPMPGGNTAATANSVSTHNSNVGIDTQLSHKLEILIHYLQVYGLVLISSIHINMPDAFNDFSEWVRVFTLNIDEWFSFLPFQQNILFWTVSFFPFLLLFLFWRISRLRGNLNQWIEAYITNWTRTKKQVGMVVGSFVVLGVTCAMLFMGNPVYKGGDNEPNNANYTAALSFFVFPLLLLFLWWLAIRRFRRGWAADSSADKDQFRSDWLSKVNFWQWLCLFLITNTFMPVARVILKQFQCTCDGNGILNTVENDSSMCYSTIDSSKHCFPTHVALTQIVALVCGCLYIIGIPIFYYLLITKTVTLVLSTSRQYKLLTLEIRRLAALPKMLKTEQVKKDLAEYRRIQFKLYYNVVNNPLNSVPASSLFAAYQERFKYTKLFQMLEKVALVVVTLFVPDQLGTLEQGGQIVWASAIIIAYLIMLLIIRPYNDPLDDSMDIIAEAGNTTSILVALSLAYKASWLSLTQANILLFVANGVILLSFVMAFIISPAKTYWRRKKRLAASEKEKETEENQIASIMDGVQAIKERRASQAQLLALGGTKDDKGDSGSDEHSVRKPAALDVEDATKSPIAAGVLFGMAEEDPAAKPATHIVRIHGEEDGSDSENEGSPDPEATRDTIDAEAEARVLEAAVAPESPDREEDHLQVRTLESPMGTTGPTSAPSSAAAGNVAARPRAFSAAAASPAAGSTPAAGGTPAEMLRSPYSHVATQGYEPNGVEQPINVQTRLEGQDQVAPLGSAPRSVHGHPGRRSSFSATLGAPLSGGRASGAPLSGSRGRAPISGGRGRPRHIAQPSLQSLEALFRATSPPPLAAGISASVEHSFPADPEVPGYPRAASASFMTLGRAMSFTARPTGAAAGSAASSPAAVGSAAASPAATSAVLTSPDASGEAAGHGRDNLSISLEADFERQFERTAAEMDRMHQLNLLKLCTPGSSEYASQLAKDSTHALAHGPAQPFATYAPLPASGSLAGRVRSAGTPVDANAVNQLGAGVNPAAAAWGRTLSANTATTFPSAIARHPYATMGAPMDRTRDTLAALRAKQARERAAAASRPAPPKPKPSVAHIDVSISADNVAPVAVTPRAAAALARLERSDSAVTHAVELARISSMSSVRGLSPPPAAAMFSPASLSAHHPAPASLAATLPPRPAMSHFQPEPAAAAAASADAASPQSVVPKSSRITSILEAEGMLPTLQTQPSPDNAAATAASQSRRGYASPHPDDLEMQRLPHA